MYKQACITLKPPHECTHSHSPSPDWVGQVTCAFNLRCVRVCGCVCVCAVYAHACEREGAGGLYHVCGGVVVEWFKRLDWKRRNRGFYPWYGTYALEQLLCRL